MSFKDIELKSGVVEADSHFRHLLQVLQIVRDTTLLHEIEHYFQGSTKTATTLSQPSS